MQEIVLWVFIDAPIVHPNMVSHIIQIAKSEQVRVWKIALPIWSKTVTLLWILMQW
ncbi:MAG: hypothetical protein V3W37_08950 [Candidatus Binatia bacterium]